MIAEKHGVESKTINRVAKRVGPWLDKFDFIPHLLRGEFEAPAAKDVFNANKVDVCGAGMVTEEV